MTFQYAIPAKQLVKISFIAHHKRHVFAVQVNIEKMIRAKTAIFFVVNVLEILIIHV